MKAIQKLIVLILLLVIGVFGYLTFTKEKKIIEANDITQIVLITEENLIQMAYPDEDINWLEQGGWMPQTLLDHYNIYADYDAEEGLVTISDGYETVKYDLVYENASREGQPLTMIKPEIKEGLLWIPIEGLQEVFHLEYDVNIEQKTLFAKKVDASYNLAKTIKKTDLKKAINEDRLLKTIGEGETLVVFPFDETYSHVMTSDYQIGYVKSENIGQVNPYEPKQKVERPSIQRSEKVYLTWEIYGRGYDTNKIGEMRGVNVISPAWYALSDNKGNFESKGSETYTAWAKERGYEIWALVSNDFKVDRTSAFLHSAQAREHFITDLLKEYKSMGYDGVNIDFENVYKEDKRQLTQFVAELTTAFRKEGMVVSMDVTVPGGSDTWSKCYDRKALGYLVDYLAIMTYDEHWASSPISGSVASYNWVKSNMEKISEMVPKEKLLLGIPYYMRVWTETPSTERANTMSVKSGVLNMPNAERFIKEKNLNLIWDENARQYYAGYIENGAVKKIWFENAASIKEKASLIKELDLGGAAVWRRGFETQDVWGIIDDAME